MDIVKIKNNTIQILFDIIIFFSSFTISFFLRGQLQQGLLPEYTDYFIEYILIIIAVKLLSFILFGIYRKIWKYASLRDFLTIVLSLASSSAVMVVIFYIIEAPYFPRSILVIDFLLSVILIVGSRFSVRMFNEIEFGKINIRKKRTLIVGAGDAGELIVREITRQRDSEYIPVGFLDDDKTKVGRQIHGIKVFGRTDEIKKYINKLAVDEIIIAIPSASGAVRKNITFKAKEAGVICKTLPTLYEIIDGKAHLYQLRDICIEDILGRKHIKIKIPEVVSEIKGKVILISGAGGSVGSEICRQIIRFSPEKMILVDHAENNLFLIEEELTNKFAFTASVPIVADIRDKETMKGVFKEYKPAIVFHTAAYKHVPLMQLNPEAAIRNNYLGTKTLIKLSISSGVKRFVIFSSDKAVKPKNIMGISKLLTEKYIQALGNVNNTKLIIVRFGNVLESNGSVVNIFKEQILSGGPVTVTHPDMERYIMTISEASQLAIQASIMGKGGEVYILNMGEPINILDLATNLIKLYGMEPEKDIKIIYTGLRNGEKIKEELIREDEKPVTTEFKQIIEAKNSSNYSGKRDEKLLNILFSIEKEIQIYDYNNLFKDLKKIVPDFNEKEMWLRK